MKRTLWKVLFGLGTALAASVMTVPAMAAEPVELEFLFGDPNRTEIFSRIVEDFNESQSEVHVTFTATGTNHLEELMTRLATGEAPDLTSQLQGYELASYVEAGHIKDISGQPYMKYIRDTELDTVTAGCMAFRWIRRHGAFFTTKSFLNRQAYPKSPKQLRSCGNVWISCRQPALHRLPPGTVRSGRLDNILDTAAPLF